MIEGPPTLLAPGAAQAVAVTLHELATNAAKYGALSTPDGQVRLEWSHAVDGRLQLRWTETGGPAAHEPARTGLGSRIIQQMIVQQKGEVRFDWRQTQGSGVRISVVTHQRPPATAAIASLLADQRTWKALALLRAQHQFRTSCRSRTLGPSRASPRAGDARPPHFPRREEIEVGSCSRIVLRL